ncbi:MAG: PrsW family glutamic-type intramembrane protease [bacterium]
MTLFEGGNAPPNLEGGLVAPSAPGAAAAMTAPASSPAPNADAHAAAAPDAPHAAPREHDRFRFHLPHALGELRALGWRTLLPTAEWIAAKPWNLIWVRWFIGLALFPLLMVYWIQASHLDFRQIAIAFAIYFALIWGIAFSAFLRPALVLREALSVGAFTAVVGIFLVLMIQRAPVIRDLYDYAEANSRIGRLIGFTLGVGLVEELAKALPVFWLYIRHRKPASLNTIVFIACVSGFAFGISEAADYSIDYAFNLQAGDWALGEYLILQFTRLITLPLLHAVWAGTLGFFIAASLYTPRARSGLALAGITLAVVLHGLYDTFSDSILGVAIAVASILIFVFYVRDSEGFLARVSKAA